MKAMVLKGIHDLRIEEQPLDLTSVPDPEPGRGEVLVKVSACGVCHTELDEIEGRTPPPSYPVIPGHQVVGTVIETGKGVSRYCIGDRVGTGWIYSSCGVCDNCLKGLDNLCSSFRATGRDVNGGYAEQFVVNEEFAFRIPDVLTDKETAPLLCAGAIGYRSLKLANITNGQPLGLTGFGASGHLVLKMVRHLYPDSKIFVFARSRRERTFARELGAFWTGDTEEEPPELLQSVIDTTPVWKPVVAALKTLRHGGRLVINSIRKEDIDKEQLMAIDYSQHLWMEKEIKSVANVASSDISEFLDLAARLEIRAEVEEYRLEDANRALIELKNREIRGAKVLVI